MRHLLLGGVRSGKSAYAEKLAAASGRPVTVLATGQARDAEMVRRITAHQARRPRTWALVEEPIHLGAALTSAANADGVLLVDSLGVWLANLLERETRPDGAGVLKQEREKLLSSLTELPGEILMVSDEVGWGGVSMHPVGRRFQDEAGALHQALAQHCERVTLVAAGLPYFLKE